MENTQDLSPTLPWVLEQNGIMIGRFRFRSDCIDMIRRRAALVSDISRFRYYNAQERTPEYKTLGEAS